MKRDGCSPPAYKHLCFIPECGSLNGVCRQRRSQARRDEAPASRASGPSRRCPAAHYRRGRIREERGASQGLHEVSGYLGTGRGLSCPGEPPGPQLSLLSHTCHLLAHPPACSSTHLLPRGPGRGHGQARESGADRQHGLEEGGFSSSVLRKGPSEPGSKTAGALQAAAP